jgi:outer membrane protein assembly factor BamB/protein-L-isoaspartate O-methyltransferase
VTVPIRRGLAVLAVFALASCAEPGDWPMFGRDASRNAISSGRNPPTDWSTEPGRERNIAWSARLGSWSFGRPVVANGLVWVGTNNDAPRDASCTADASVLMCFRERDGRFLGQQASPEKKGLDRHGNWGHIPLRCTPLVEGDRLWFINNCWEAICLDIGPLKRAECAPVEVWRTDLIARTGAWPQVLGMGFGIALSIGSSCQGRIYVSTGNGVDWKTGKPARPEAPALVCLDMNSGEVTGRERSGISAGTRMANWSSPVTTRAPDGKGGERTLVLFGGGDGFLYAFDPVPTDEPVPGTLRELWKVDCRREGSVAVGITATPVVDQGRVYVALGDESDTSGPGNLVCVDLAAGGRLWNSADFGVSFSTPVVLDGRLIAASAEGIVHCLDAATGRKIWEVDCLSTIVPSPILVDGRVYLSNNDDEVMILDVRVPEATPRVLKREMSGCGLTTPAFAGGTLYVAGRRSLFALREGEPGAPASSTPAAKRGRAPDAVFLPTPMDVVRRILELAAVKESDVVYDLGSGDGRIVIAAAADFKCRSVGIEIDRDLVRRSRGEIQRVRLEERARIEHEDLLKADFSQASVVTLYVGGRLNGLLLPKLQALRPGTRVVSHQFPVPGVKPDRVLRVESRDDGRDHDLYLYTTPLRRD